MFTFAPPVTTILIAEGPLSNTFNNNKELKQNVPLNIPPTRFISVRLKVTNLLPFTVNKISHLLQLKPSCYYM